MQLRITNTLTGHVEPFAPMHDKEVKLYVCGITPYDYAHLGHGRVYVTFDLLYRLLTFLGYKVTYVRNYTDIDDKIIDRAEREYGDRFAYKKITDKFIAAYQEDMQALNCIAPHIEPRVTEEIDTIIQFIEGLIEKGVAYVADGDVYFSIDAFPSYMQLSRHDLHDLRAGARVEPNSRKRDPLDFALWKAEPAGQFYKSPWGYGRPGWHIECSAMASRYLGNHIDIHAGGQDLIFPHHENEIAQSEALHGAPFAKYWMHNGFVQINKEKMSKSLKNFLTLKDVFKEFDPMVVRMYYLAHHYRAPLDFSIDDLKSTMISYTRLCKQFASVENIESVTTEQMRAELVVQQMLEYLLDDLNTSGAFGVLFTSLPTLAQDAARLRVVKAFIMRVFGLTLIPPVEREIIITDEIKKLLDEREAARVAKDWKRSDELRTQLQALGYTVHDKKV